MSQGIYKVEISLLCTIKFPSSALPGQVESLALQKTLGLFKNDEIVASFVNTIYAPLCVDQGKPAYGGLVFLGLTGVNDPLLPRESSLLELSKCVSVILNRRQFWGYFLFLFCLKSTLHHTKIQHVLYCCFLQRMFSHWW